MKTTLLIGSLLFPFYLKAYTGFSKKSETAFVQNRGQLTDHYGKPRQDIDFRLSAPGIDIFIGIGQLHYQWNKAVNSEQGTENRVQRIEYNTEPQTSNSTIETYRLDVTLIGADPDAEIITEQQQEYAEHYYLPQCPAGTIAHSYKKIIYKNIYPNIDWVLYLPGNTSSLLRGGQEGLKYDFIVHPGGDAKKIQMRYDGASSVALSPKGGLGVTTPFGSITEHAPYCYEGGTLRTVPSSFVLRGNVQGFDIAPYTGTLVIDPQVEWASYYGGSKNEQGFGWGKYGLFKLPIYKNVMVTDNFGNIYLGSATTSTNNIATTGAYQQNLSGNTDLFLAKFNSSGTLLWSTYLGGTSYETFAGACADGSGNIYIGGATGSSNFPATSGSHQSLFGGNPGDGVLAKFSSSGALTWASYYGGSGIDRITDIAINKNNIIYITGHSTSAAGIATTGAYQSGKTNPGGQTYFLAKFDTAGTRHWGTYYADTSFLYSFITCDNDDNAYMAGHTDERDGIATAGAYQVLPYPKPVYLRPDAAFLVKFDKAGKRLWGTYYDGDSIENVFDVACDASGNVYLAGFTNSTLGIASTNAFMPQRPAPQSANNYDAFLVKFDPAGARQWATYYGGADGDDNFTDIAFDKYGDVCIAGSTSSLSGITTPGAWPINLQQDSAKGMFVKFDKDGQRLWATYVGGNKSDHMGGVAVDAAGNTYLSGTTASTTGIATTNGHQQTYGGGSSDIFIIKTTPDSVVYLEQPFHDTLMCRGTAFKVGYYNTRSFRPGNVFFVELSDATGSFASALVIGSVTSTASGYISCSIPYSIPLGTHYRIRIVSSSPYYASNPNGIDIEIKDGPAKPIATGDSSLCEGHTLHLSASCATPGVSFVWSGPLGFVSQSSDTVIENINPLRSGDYVVSVSPFYCRIKDTLQVQVIPLPLKPVITHNIPVCEGDTLELDIVQDTTGGVSYNYSWPGATPGGHNDLLFIKPENSGNYIAIANRSGCTVSDTAFIQVIELPTVSVNSNSPITAGEEIRLFAQGDSTGLNYFWKGPGGFTSVLANPVIPYATPAHTGSYVLSVVRDGCLYSNITVVTVRELEDNIFVVFPNPNKGNFTIKAILKKDQKLYYDVHTNAGQQLYRGSAESNNRLLSTDVSIPSAACGSYILRVMVDGKFKAIPFDIVK